MNSKTEQNCSEESVNIETIANKSSHDERKILSRLILQTIMFSDSSSFMSNNTKGRINTEFLSDNPMAIDTLTTLSYMIPSSPDRNMSYYDRIAEVIVKWKPSVDELQDLTGNVWKTFTLSINCSIISINAVDSQNISDDLLSRLKCISNIGDLITELREMVPNPIRIMELNNDERAVRDRAKKLLNSIEWFSNIIMGENRELRIGLRINGRPRRFVQSILCSQFDPGEYPVTIREGSKRNPILKKYILVVPQQPEKRAYLYRKN